MPSGTCGESSINKLVQGTIGQALEGEEMGRYKGNRR